MTKILPFRAVTYNQQEIHDLARVVCPPYDVISPTQQQYYHTQEPHNFIRILLAKDSQTDDKYKRAAGLFQQWLKEKIFIQDTGPAIYFYSQQYSVKGEKRIRLGFIALLRLDEKKSSVFGHERTRLEPKEDRLKLLKQVKASLSPIFAVFSDRRRIIQRIYQQIQEKKTFIDITDSESVTHKVWRLDSPEMLADIEQKMSDENIFIADGHHRYEVACLYREEMRKKLGQLTGEEPFNYILCYFTNTESRGLTIMPIHRLVKLEPGFDFAKFTSSLRDYFDLEELKDKTRFFFLMQKAGSTEHVIGMAYMQKFWLLRLRNVKILDKIISDKQKEYRSLDVAILNYVILKKILGLDIENKEKITFSHDADELLRQLANDNSAAAFFLNPAKIGQIISLALTGEKMPSKSTYFYPKVLSGLVINKFS